MQFFSMPVPYPQPCRLNDILVPSCRHGAEVMLVIAEILGSHPLRQAPVTGLCKWAVAGYLIVNFIPLKVMPPLMLVSGMAAMYLGAVES